MKVVFLSDRLPVDPTFLPLSTLLDMVDRDEPGALERVRASSARAQLMARNAAQTGVRPTFFLVMPENVLQHWRKLQDAYTGERICSKEQIRNLINIDHPEWKAINIGISAAVPFFLTQVWVQATDFQYVILDKERIMEGKPVYRPPIYKDELHGD